jgi:hypothetical protein
MTTVCSSTLLPDCFVAALVTTITMTPITGTTDPKYRPTIMPSANSLTQNIFGGLSHPHPKARLDNGRRSCQLNDGYLDNLSYERNCQWTPVEDTIGVSPARPSWERLYDLKDDCRRACGADDVVLSIPASVQINTFSDD